MRRHVRNENMKAYLKKYQCPNLDEVKKQQAIADVMNQIEDGKQRTSMPAFLWGQLQFIRKRIWLFQLCCMVLLAYLAVHKQFAAVPNQGYLMVSMAAPLLILTSVKDIMRIFNKPMLELEYVTRYSLHRTMIARVMILGIVDFVMLLGLTGMVARSEELELLRLAVYGFVPFLLCAALLLCLMNYYSGEKLLYSVCSLSVMLIIFFMLGTRKYLAIYEMHQLWIWFLIGILAIGFMFYETKRQQKNRQVVDWRLL